MFQERPLLQRTWLGLSQCSTGLFNTQIICSIWRELESVSANEEVEVDCDN